MKDIILMCFLGISVILAGKSDKYMVQKVLSVDSVHVVEGPAGFLALKTICSVPNPCYKFSHFELNTNNDINEITLFVKIEKNVNCIQIVGKLEAEIKIPENEIKGTKFVFTGSVKNLEMVLSK